jgi:hypothetical protein
MSDTPRTDKAKTFKVHAGCPELVSKDFARELKRENEELLKAIHLACDDRDYFMDLQEKEKARLEYLLREYNIYRFGHEERLDRDDIDEAMKGEA